MLLPCPTAPLFLVLQHLPTSSTLHPAACPHPWLKWMPRSHVSKYSVLNLRTNCHIKSALGRHSDPQGQDPGRILAPHIQNGISGPGLRETSCPLHPSPEGSRTHPQSSHCHGCVTCPSTVQHRGRPSKVGNGKVASSAPPHPPAAWGDQEHGAAHRGPSWPTVPSWRASALWACEL